MVLFLCSQIPARSWCILILRNLQRICHCMNNPIAAVGCSTYCIYIQTLLSLHLFDYSWCCPEKVFLCITIGKNGNIRYLLFFNCNLNLHIPSKCIGRAGINAICQILKTSSLYKGLLIFRFFLFRFLPFTFVISQCFIHSFNQAVTAVSRSGNCIYICILPADHLLENPVFRSLHIRLIICIIIQYKLRYLPIGNLYRNRHLASVALTGSCVNTILKVTSSIIFCRFFH